MLKAVLWCVWTALWLAALAHHLPGPGAAFDPWRGLVGFLFGCGAGDGVVRAVRAAVRDEGEELS
jgi:hypothetical protein